MHFPPFFHHLSIIFFPQHIIWPYFCPLPRAGGGRQTEKYTPLLYYASDNVNKIAEEEEEENGGTYVKKLLEEIIQLKEKIERLSRKRDQKENLPESGVKQVNFGNRQPLADHRPPSAGHRPPSAGQRPPSAVLRPPSAVHRPPLANKQPSQICAGKTAPNVWQRMQSYRPPGPRARDV